MRASIAGFLLVLAACDAAPPYASHPFARTVKSDGYVIHVVPQANQSYVAFGGEEAKDGQVQYRQQRAIEIASGCRIKRVTSTKGEPLLRATVRCK
jgi:hypothetical protein